MQKHVNLVDLVKSFPTNIYLQNLASIQKRTSPVKFALLAEKSGKGSISNLSTKVPRGLVRAPSHLRQAGRIVVSVFRLELSSSAWLFRAGLGDWIVYKIRVKVKLVIFARVCRSMQTTSCIWVFEVSFPG